MAMEMRRTATVRDLAISSRLAFDPLLLLDIMGGKKKGGVHFLAMVVVGG